MSERFVRCVHCGQHHEFFAAVCPLTGKPMRTAPAPPPPPRAPLQSQNSDSMPTNPLARRDLLGTTIGGKYRVKCILGQGGMGTVYEAEHMTIGRQVAVKVLHPKQMRKKDAVKRFHHEARAAGAIGHPNICEVYDLGTLDDGCPYLVMEKLVGKTLADRIKEEGGLPFDEVVDVLTQVLSGLVAAHDKNIVHRDIKPENVFLTERVGCPPVAKILDFGVSKMVGNMNPAIEGMDEMDLTRTGMVMGTPYYMSPEQARGERNLDARVDLYACGVLFYEVLTGRRPFLGNNYNVLLLNILSATPRPPRELRPDLPPAFERVINKAMTREREGRYQSAAEFQRDLQRLRNAIPPAPPASSRARPVAAAGGRPMVDPRIAMRAAPAPPIRMVPVVRPPIVELPSDVLSTPSSVDIPVTVDPVQAPRTQRVASGFDDVPTEIALHDFSDSDEAEPATTLMHDDEIARLARSSRRPSQSPPSGAKVAPFDSSITEVTETAVKRPKRGPSPEPFDENETLKMSREEALRNLPPHARKAPKSSR